MNETFVELIFTFVKFALVGLLGIAVDFGLTFLCKELFKSNKYVANSIGFATAASSNFVFNRIWTFASTDPDVSGQYIKFITVSLIGLVISNTILKLLHEQLEWNFYLSKLIAIGFVFTWNFAINLVFTFN